LPTRRPRRSPAVWRLDLSAIGATDIVSSGEEALTLLMGGLKRPNALVTDVRLKGRLSGWEVARRIREKDASFPVVYVTAFDREWPP
jgi:CheY-like chemotaxis protein